MLKLKNIFIKYKNNCIYDQAYFYANENDLTVIIGKSGSGKSTLHELLTFQRDGQYEYFYNDKDITHLSMKEKQEFIREHMGIVNQIPTFINDLTIQDHIHLCQSLFNGFNVDEIAEQLEIKHTYQQYPQQLSGGEKIRVSILLAMIHQPEILIFDEPTASLDRHHTQSVVKLLKDYAHQGHTVIIFTHDSLIKKEADVIYEINDKKLVCNIKEHVQTPEKKTTLIKANTKHYLQYIYKMFKHHRLLKLTMISFIALSIGLCSFSILYGQSVIQKYNQEMNLLDKGGVFFREASYILETPSIGKEEIKEIENSAHIRIWPYYYYEDYFYHLSNKKITIYKNNTAQYEQHPNINSYLVLSTYNEKFNYKKNFIDYQIDNNEGVYISTSFLYYLKTGKEFDIYKIGDDNLNKLCEEIDENTEIEFPIAVPTYRTIEGDLEEVHFEIVTLKMKIKGIYNNRKNVNMATINLDPDIFFPLSIMEKYQKKLSQKIPEDAQPFYPNFYQFIVDEKYDFHKAKEDIEALGLKVKSDYNDAYTKADIIHNINESIFMISGLTMLVVLMLFYGVKYNQKQDYIDFIKFFTNKGIAVKQSKKILGTYFLYEGFICMILSVIFMFLCAYLFIVFIYNDILIIRPSFFIFCIIFSLCIEVGIPILMIRRMKK